MLAKIARHARKGANAPVYHAFGDTPANPAHPTVPDVKTWRQGGLIQQQGSHFVCGQGCRKIITLPQIATQAGEEGQLCGVFDPFPHHLEIQTMRQCDDGANDGSVIGIARNILYKGAIHFE